MKLNRIEKLAMDNPIRRVLMRRFDARMLHAVADSMPGGLALEIGCGAGAGGDVIKTVFGAAHVDGFDLDAGMVRRAKQGRHESGRHRFLWVGNARAIPVADNTYDSVMTFGAIHHIRHWQSAIDEIFRVLKPGGHFAAEEIGRAFITHPLWRRVLDHPQVNRFDLVDFTAQLTGAGFAAVRADGLLGMYIWAAARKPE